MWCDKRLRIGSCSKFCENKLGYVLDGWKSENDGWSLGYWTAARKDIGSSLLFRMSFDKDNPANERGGAEEVSSDEGKIQV
jgi:hypothetical protein